MTRPDRPTVLQVITQLGLGGAEAVAIDICSGLDPSQVAGLFCVRSGVHDDVGAAWNDQLQAAGMTVITGSRLPTKLGGLVQAGERLARTLRALRPDIVHVHTEIPEVALAVASIVGPRVSIPHAVRTVHNSTLWPRWRRFAAWTERRLTNVPVAAVSASALAGLTSLRVAVGLAPVPEHLTRIIHNGRPVPRRSQLDAPRDDAVRVLFAGRLEEQKGADLLPSILRHIDPSVAGSIRLTVAGSGSLGAWLRTELPRVGGIGSVAVTDPIPTLSEKLTDFDMVIMPSRFEGLALLAIEAGLAGVALVLTDAPGLIETVPPDHPWVAPAGDAVAFASVVTEAIRRRERWPGIDAAALDNAMRRFELSVMQQAYRAFYSEVAATRLASNESTRT